MASHESQQRHAQRWYALLAVLRVLFCVCGLGMIHPDEFFQSQEVMARHVLHDDPALQSQLHLPWEFQLPTPNRSVLFPSLVAGLPYLLLQSLGIPLSGYLLLVVPRLLLCVVSFGIDRLLFRCAQALGVANPMDVVLCFASSWTTLVFLSRPFSNTFETVVLALSMATLLCLDPHRRVVFRVFHLQTLVLGSLLAVGFFTRFTFPFFFLPLGLELVRRQDAILCQGLHKKTTASLLMQRLRRAVQIAVDGFVAFLFWSLIFIAIDTWYFSGAVAVSSLIIAPWNNLLYNLQHDNLELHGVHPRVTHALVNMPLLFGPLYVAFLFQMGRQPSKTAIWSAACVLMPLALISIAPHQEPRFLLPLLVPLHLFAGASIILSPVSRTIWVVFNVALAIFFGVLHQGGVLPLLLSLSKSRALEYPGCRFSEDPFVLRRDEPLLFYKTYMPPRFALANALEPWGPTFRVIDLAGGTHMESQLRDVATFTSLLVVAPASVEITRVAAAWGGQVRIIGSCFPHISTEDLDLAKPLTLQIYRLEKE